MFMLLVWEHQLGVGVSEIEINGYSKGVNISSQPFWDRAFKNVRSLNYYYYHFRKELWEKTWQGHVRPEAEFNTESR